MLRSGASVLALDRLLFGRVPDSPLFLFAHHSLGTLQLTGVLLHLVGRIIFGVRYKPRIDFPTGKHPFPKTLLLLQSLWCGGLGRHLSDTTMLNAHVHGFSSVKEVCLKTVYFSRTNRLPGTLERASSVLVTVP